MTNETLTLVEKLRTETESLREQYISLMTEFAEKEFAQIAKEAQTQTYPKYDDFATPGFVKSKNNWCDYAQGKKYRKAVDRFDKIKKIAEAGEQSYVARQIELAERHYTDSIIKLAMRIEKKNLDQNNLTMTTSHIGVNIETTITDGTLTVRAWTIIAAGDIIKPHYRYLVK